MIIENNTHYFTEYTKSFNCVPDPNSFEFESNRRQGYFQRLYFEYIYTKSVHGSTYFYTFTYNNKSIPKFLGRNVFSYTDIRHITNGALIKRLKRDYDTTLKYFCACETGEGKGSRGLGNNPHYHFIFFLTPNDLNNITLPDQFEFYRLLRELWHGTDKYIDWRKAKYGHVQPGNDVGLVTNTDAFSYVCKYVVKDASERATLTWIEQYYHEVLISKGVDYSVVYSYYKYMKQYRGWTHDTFDEEFHLRDYNRWRHSLTADDRDYRLNYDRWEDYLRRHVYNGCKTVIPFLAWYRSYYFPTMLAQLVSKWKNEYSGKVRCSKSLGIYGLNFVESIDLDPKFKIPVKGKWKIQTPCLYYFRKLYYDVRICSVTGNPLYILNDRGTKLKLQMLNQRIVDFEHKTRDNILICLLNNTGVSLLNGNDFPDIDFVTGKLGKFKNDTSFVDWLSGFDKNPQKSYILHLYSVWHHVYQYRAYHKSDIDILIDSNCYVEHYKHDYEKFLRSNLSFIDYQNGRVYDLHSRSSYLTFSVHPVFQSYVGLFNVLDIINDFADRFTSNFKKLDFESKSNILKKFNQFKYDTKEQFMLNNCLT